MYSHGVGVQATGDQLFPRDARLARVTNKRLLYLGLEPRDLLAAPDLPPTFEERDFALDTMVHVTSGRTFFGIAKAVVITTPNEKIKLGVPSAHGRKQIS